MYFSRRKTQFARSRLLAIELFEDFDVYRECIFIELMQALRIVQENIGIEDKVFPDRGRGFEPVTVRPFLFRGALLVPTRCSVSVEHLDLDGPFGRCPTRTCIGLKITHSSGSQHRVVNRENV